jgi:hypothetical protein
MANAVFSPIAPFFSAPGRRKRYWFAGIAIAIALVMAVALWFIDANWPYRYRKIHPLLEDVLASQVKVSEYHRTYFPNPGFVANGLTLRRKSAPELPPIGTARSMVVQGSWLDLVMLRHRVRRVEVAGLRVEMPPPGSRASQEDFPPGSSADFTGPDTAIAEMVIHDSVLDIQRTGAVPLSFLLRRLVFTNVLKNRAAGYTVDMQNALPTAQIHATGNFGPLNPQNLGATPVSGTFTITALRLHDVGEISGTLSATGRFRGPLASIAATADSTTSDFAVEDGHRSAVAATIQCTVNGLNGDVVIHGLAARTGATVIHAAGAVQQGRQGSPKATNLDLEVKDGRAEDLLRLFMHQDVPVTGIVWVHAHAYLAAAVNGAAFLHRLHVQGTFAVPREVLSDHRTEESLTAFSDRAQGKKAPDPKVDSKTDRSASSDALSSLEGTADIRDGVVSSRRLTFRVPGAEAHVDGTFNLHSKVVHLVGNLRMEADISHAETGFRSWLLKPLAPFFRKKHAGAVVPVAVTGGPGHYQVTQDLAHDK